MIPDLGKYAGAVLSSYGASLGLIVVLVGASIWRSKRTLKALREVEERVKRNG